MALMDAEQYDPTSERRRRKVIITILAVLLIGSWIAYHLRDHSERNTTRKFFAALEKQDYETAYGVWFHDPTWRQHLSKYTTYAFNDFYRDWGPGGEWGLIKSYHVDCSLSPRGGSGVIVQVTVNQRAEHAYVWVQKSDRTLSFSPQEIECGNWWTWVTE
jgi:hypothetical protein